MSKNDDGRNISMLIAGFGLGALVGTVIGLLVAPKAGRELRADIADYSRDYYDKAKEISKDAYDKSKDKARQAYEAGRERAKEYSARVGEKLTEAKEHLGDTAGRITQSIKTGIDAAKQAQTEETEEA